ncbi:MAG: hydrogenase maturation protease [Candidatus Zixiibacteriota bacterium]|nr:MAG: hydrogenase maturation protease [candidate division Zixibacteria bacterium]
MTADAKTLVIGIGNEYRGDDAVGLDVARRLSQSTPGKCEVIQANGAGIDLIGKWENYDHVIVVDAVRSESAPGTIHRIDAVNEELPDAWFHSSTHTVSLPEAIGLAGTLGLMPTNLTIYGIEGENFEPGVSLSPAVKQAAEHLIARILDEVATA